MTAALKHPDDERDIPEWELCDRLVRSLRKVRLNNQEVAQIMGVRADTVSRWVNGHNKPSHAVLTIWSDMTGVDRCWLEHGDGCTLRGCRDSNPEPSVLELVHTGPVSAVRTSLTANRPLSVVPALRLVVAS